MKKIIDNFLQIMKYKYSDFDGVANRTEFLLFATTWLLLIVLTSILVTISEGMPLFWIISATLKAIVVIVLFLPFVALCVRRMHDIGKNGKWVLINLIPVVGNIWFVFLALKKSVPNIYRTDEYE